MKYKKGSFIIIPNKELLCGLNATAQALFFWICNYANENGECYPSRKTLAKCLGSAPITVDRSMKVLEKAGLVVKQKRKNGKENKTNLYQIMLLEGSNKMLPPSNKKNTRVVTKCIQRTQSNELNSLNSTLQVKNKSYGKEDINLLIDSFEQIMGFKSAGKKDRFMAKHLLNNFNTTQLKAMMIYCSTNSYAPRIGSIEKMWHKRGDIIAGIKSLQNETKANKPKVTRI